MDIVGRLTSKPVRIGITAVLLVAGVAGGSYWWMEGRWHPPPSIFDTPVDDVMGYLALEDFSKLPLEERMKFLLDFADRFRGLKQSESVALSGFLAGLSGPAREQLTQNARTLAKDIFLEGAEGYLALKTDEERSQYLDQWIVRWMKTGEMLTRGKERQEADSERLEDVKGDFKRDRKSAIEGFGSGGVGRQEVVQMMDFWESDVQKATTPKEQGQIMRFVKGLRNHVMK